MALEEIIKTDVLVVGGGQAGLFAAIKAKEQGATVTLVDKGYAGIAGQLQNICTINVFDPERHDMDEWVESFHAVNEYMDNPEWIELAFSESLDRWNDLSSWGLEVYKFDKKGEVYISPASDPGGEHAPGQRGVGGTGEGRVATPVEFKFVPPRQQLIMRKQALKVGVNIIDRLMVTDLVVQDGRVAGAIGVPADSCDTYVFQAKAVVLCAGTSGLKVPGIRTVTTTGDAHAMAYRVGCGITGKEWTDPHPSRADFPAYPWSGAIDRDFLVPKHKLAGHHGIPITNVAGELVDGMRPDEELKKKSLGQIFEPIAVCDEVHKGNAPIYMEVSGDPNTAPMNHSPKDMPRDEIDETAMASGKVRMVLGRAVGQSWTLSDGIWPLDTSCATEVPGLYAAGDCLGARPGYAAPGFAAAYCSVTGARAGTNAAKFAQQAEDEKLDKDEVARLKKVTWMPMERKGGFTPGWATQVVQNVLSPYWVLYYKHGERLQSALTQMEFLQERVVPTLTARDHHELRLAHEVKNVVLHAEMKLRASMFRTESRWSHYREDYPMRDDPSWLAWIKIKEEDGTMTLSKVPVPKKWWPDLSLPYEERYPMQFPGETKK